ncbi:MAG: phosphoribosylglycinamide formyltransferase [Alphaproteobacteria bacterium]|jgi:phosphoribosylglycinamide formyltransferase-1|nr:phosphoribosylglycinamide formyltransferase [Beijerinckiaceae bacterium]NBQ39954.1 phosphoribosylglycinamide formyltransferase [Alphaproteobacteria bacterium]
MRRIRTAILISGRGTNMVALIEAAKHPDYPAEIVLVISNDADAGGLARAQALGIETIAIPHGAFPTREAFETEIDRVLREYKVELVCLAGFMRVLTASFIEKWPNRLLNIHPSLLPELKGLHTHERALAEKATRHGCTVHFVVPELDAGPIIDQATVPILPDDTADTLAARVLEQEIKLYPKALAEIARQMAQK